MSECDEIREDLPCFVFGDLSPRRMGQVGLHVGGCAACRKELGEAESTLALAALWEAPEPPSEAVSLHLETESAGILPTFRRKAWAAAAAVLVLAFVLIFYPSRSPEDREASAPPPGGPPAGPVDMERSGTAAKPEPEGLGLLAQFRLRQERGLKVWLEKLRTAGHDAAAMARIGIPEEALLRLAERRLSDEDWRAVAGLLALRGTPRSARFLSREWVMERRRSVVTAIVEGMEPGEARTGLSRGIAARWWRSDMGFPDLPRNPEMLDALGGFLALAPEDEALRQMRRIAQAETRPQAPDSLSRCDRALGIAIEKAQAPQTVVRLIGLFASPALIGAVEAKAAKSEALRGVAHMTLQQLKMLRDQQIPQDRTNGMVGFLASRAARTLFGKERTHG